MFKTEYLPLGPTDSQSKNVPFISIHNIIHDGLDLVCYTLIYISVDVALSWADCYSL